MGDGSGKGKRRIAKRGERIQSTTLVREKREIFIGNARKEEEERKGKMFITTTWEENKTITTTAGGSAHRI